MRLLYFFISSSVLIGLVLGVRSLFRKQVSPGMMYALWLIPLLRLLIPFGFVELPVFGGAAWMFTSPYQTLGIMADGLEDWLSGEAGQQSGEAGALAGNARTGKIFLDKTMMDLADGKTDGDGELLQEKSTGTADEAGMQGADVSGSQKAVHTYMEDRIIRQNRMVWMIVACIWVIGSLMTGLYAILSNIRLKKGVSLMEEAKGDCPLPVYCSNAVVSPCLFGLLHPSILVNHMVRDDEELYQNVLRHELSHYRQKDHVWTFLRILLCVIYWWDPLVWIGALHAGEDAELACDARVIRGMSVQERKSYGYSLLRLLTHAAGGGHDLCIATSMSGGKKSIKKRMEGISGNVQTKKYVLFPLCLVLVALMLYGCSIPSTKSWMRTDWNTEETLPGQMQADYEFALREDIKSRLFYYEVYRYGELNGLGMFDYGDFDNQNGRFGLRLEEMEDEETQKEAYYVVLEENGVRSDTKLSVLMPSEIASGGSVLWAEEEKQQVQAGDDLVLMAQFIQPAYPEGTITSVYPCEDLAQMAEEERAEALGDTYFTVLIHMVLSGLPEEQLAEQQMKYLSQRSSKAVGEISDRREFIEAWAEAFTGKDGKALLGMMSEELKQQMIEEGWLMMEEEDDFVYFGWSSPWPGMFTDKGYRILESDGGKTEILYYAGDSTPHLYVWRETLEYVKNDSEYQMVSESMEIFDEISSAEEFYHAYPDGEITGTEMDYQKNGLGEYLNQNAIERLNDKVYARLFDAELAALDLLNISAMYNGEWQDISDRVTTSVEDTSGVTTVQITFLQDNSMIEVSMIQPYGERGIWIPENADGISY